MATPTVDRRAEPARAPAGPARAALPPAGGLDVVQTLELLADTIVESLGFEVCVVNLVDEDDGALVVAAVSGPDDVRDLLLHRRQGREGWTRLLEASEAWGRLRFLDHALSVADPVDVLSWIPDIPVSSDADAWHPEDALFAPLTATDGRHLGVLSVDVPRDGRRPGPATRHALEAFVVTASLAVEHAHLAAASCRSDRRFQAVFDSSPVAIALVGPDRRLTRVNPAFCRLLGRSYDDLVGHDPLEFTHPDDLRAADEQVAVVRAARLDATRVEARPVDKRYLLPDGSVVWGRLHLAPLDDEEHTEGVIAQVEDITERKRAEALLVQQAHFDALTGLPNRGASMQRLTDALEREGGRDGGTAVFFCDVDGLKRVNDVHGHAVGDAYLQSVGDRIRRSIRPSDLVGRLSGDEFVVVVEGVRSGAELGALAEQVLAAVSAPLRAAGVELAPTVSIGVARSTCTDATPGGLLARADAAMYRAKGTRPGTWAQDG